CQSGKSSGNYSVSKALHPKEKKTEQSYGASDRCDLCDRKEPAGKIQKTPERRIYGREMPKKVCIVSVPLLNSFVLASLTVAAFCDQLIRPNVGFLR
ncbi:hypothetical protein AVEN_42405-1, partial [Araneus ventricosus]